MFFYFDHAYRFGKRHGSGLLNEKIYRITRNDFSLTYIDKLEKDDYFPKTIMIKPWDKNIIPEIEKSIMNSDTGLNAQNDSETIIINIPPLTEERRLVLVKQVKNEGEKCKITIRNIRKESNDSLKKLHEEGLSEDSIRSGESGIQEITNSFINKIDNLISSKEKEILTV